ncbi:MAG: SDR family oxidoreductase [Pseudomonadota bacterium]
MTIAVTAANGQLSSQIIKALQANDPKKTVIGLARSPAKARNLGIEIRPGDYDDRAALESSLTGVDAVLLLSGNGPPEPRVEQHRNVIAAAKANGVRRIVYTSVQGADTGTSFSPVIQSNRQTEADIRESGLDWVIGRNWIYIEPDLEYLETYRKKGEIANSAGDGQCGYTTRQELAQAYASMLTGPQHSGQTYFLHGAFLTQAELVAHMNRAFGTALVYRPMSVAAYRDDRIGELGEMMGTIIAGIYEGIRGGVYSQDSDFEKAAGRPHQSWDDYFGAFFTA